MMHTDRVQIQVNTPGCCVMHCPAAGLNLIQPDGGGTKLRASEQEASSCQILQRAGSKALILHQNLPPQCPGQWWLLVSAPPWPLFTISEESSEGTKAAEGHPKNTTNPAPGTQLNELFSLNLLYENGLMGQRGHWGCQQRTGRKGDPVAVCSHPKKIKLEVWTQCLPGSCQEVN